MKSAYFEPWFSFMMCLKKEVEHLSGMVTAFDGFGSHQTRLVVVVNGLDSCEQDRVLDVLETVNVLFTQVLIGKNWKFIGRGAYKE